MQQPVQNMGTCHQVMRAVLDLKWGDIDWRRVDMLPLTIEALKVQRPLPRGANAWR